jgi:hypothetical protein
MSGFLILKCYNSSVGERSHSWSSALVLKTGVPQGTVGSNPTLSANNKLYMPEALDFQNECQQRYKKTQSLLEELLNSNPDIPEPISALLRELLAERYFDTATIDDMLFDNVQHTWAMKIHMYIVMLKTCEAFVDAERRFNKFKQS